MSDHIMLDRASLCGAADALRVSAEPLAAADLDYGFAFESVTGVACAAHEFLGAVGRAVAQLSQGSTASAQLVTQLVERGGELDLQLAAAVEASPQQASPEQECA